jgi:hypothetical protein
VICHHAAAVRSFATSFGLQFCINLANEKLQQHFNQHVFKWEQVKRAGTWAVMVALAMRQNASAREADALQQPQKHAEQGWQHCRAGSRTHDVSRLLLSKVCGPEIYQTLSHFACVLTAEDEAEGHQAITRTPHSPPPSQTFFDDLPTC